MAKALRRPNITIVERGEFDWKESECDTEAFRPKELVVQVDLPELDSAASVDLDVRPLGLELTVPGLYHDVLSLLCTVREDEAKATFSVKKHRLTVTLPVAPPSAQELMAREAASAKATEAQADASGDHEEERRRKEREEREIHKAEIEARLAARARGEEGEGSRKKKNRKRKKKKKKSNKTPQTSPAPPPASGPPDAAPAFVAPPKREEGEGGGEAEEEDTFHCYLETGDTSEEGGEQERAIRDAKSVDHDDIDEADWPRARRSRRSSLAAHGGGRRRASRVSFSLPDPEAPTRYPGTDDEDERMAKAKALQEAQEERIRLEAAAVALAKKKRREQLKGRWPSVSLQAGKISPALSYHEQERQFILVINIHNLRREQVKCEFHPNEVTCSMNTLVPRKEFQLTIPLASSIVPARCSFKLNPKNMTMTLVKEVAELWEGGLGDGPQGAKKKRSRKRSGRGSKSSDNLNDKHATPKQHTHSNQPTDTAPSANADVRQQSGELRKKFDLMRKRHDARNEGRRDYKGDEDEDEDEDEDDNDNDNDDGDDNDDDDNDDDDNDKEKEEEEKQGGEDGGTSLCPNADTPFHECSQWCLDHWGTTTRPPKAGKTEAETETTQLETEAGTITMSQLADLQPLWTREKVNGTKTCPPSAALHLSNPLLLEIE